MNQYYSPTKSDGNYQPYMNKSSLIKKNMIFNDFSQIIRLFDDKVKLLLQENKKRQIISRSKCVSIPQIAKECNISEEQSKTIEPQSKINQQMQIEKTDTVNVVSIADIKNQITAIQKMGVELAQKYSDLQQQEQNLQTNKKLIRRFIARIKQKLQQYVEYCQHNWKQMVGIGRYLENVSEEIKEFQSRENNIGKLFSSMFADQRKSGSYANVISNLDNRKLQKIKLTQNKTQKNIIIPEYSSPQLRTRVLGIDNKYKRSAVYEGESKNTESDFHKNSERRKTLQLRNNFRTTLQNIFERPYSCLQLDFAEMRKRKIIAKEDSDRSTNTLRDQLMSRNRMIANMINRYAKDYAAYLRVKSEKYKKRRNRSLNNSKNVNRSLTQSPLISNNTQLRSEGNIMKQKISKLDKKELIKNQLYQNHKKSNIMSLEWSIDKKEAQNKVSNQTIKEYTELKTIQELITLNKLSYKYQQSNLKNNSSAHLNQIKSIKEEQFDDQQQEREIKKEQNNKQQIIKNQGNIQNRSTIKLAQIKLKKKSCSASALSIPSRINQLQKKNIEYITRSKSHKKQQQQTSKGIFNKFMHKLHSENQNQPLKINKIEVHQLNQEEAEIQEQNFNNDSFNRVRFQYSSFMKKKNKIKFRNESVIKKCKMEMQSQLTQIQNQISGGKNINGTQFGFFRKYPVCSSKNQNKKIRDETRNQYQGIFINGIKQKISNEESVDKN